MAHVCVEKRISPASGGVAGNRHTRLSAAAAPLALLLGAAAAQVVFLWKDVARNEGGDGERSTNFLVELISLVWKVVRNILGSRQQQINWKRELKDADGPSQVNFKSIPE